MSQLRTYQRKVARVISTDIEETDLDAVTLEIAKLYAKSDTDADDDIFDIIIPSALSDFETFTGKLFFERTVTSTFESEGDAILILQYLPVVSITSVQKDGGDVDYELKGDRIEVDAVGEIEVVYECGLFEDTSSIGREAQLGMMKYITSNYEDRQDVAAMGIAEMPNGSRKHWMRYKNFSL